MSKIIKTNLSLDNENNIMDFQSRVIDVESWESFVNEIKEAKTISRISVLGFMNGVSIPRQANVKELTYDNFHLSCVIANYVDMRTKKLVYLIQ